MSLLVSTKRLVIYSIDDFRWKIGCYAGKSAILHSVAAVTYNDKFMFCSHQNYTFCPGKFLFISAVSLVTHVQNCYLDSSAVFIKTRSQNPFIGLFPFVECFGVAFRGKLLFADCIPVILFWCRYFYAFKSHYKHISATWHLSQNYG